MSKHREQVEKGIGEVAVGLFKTRKIDGMGAYISELETIISYFTEEYIAAKRMERAEQSPPFAAALDAVSRIGASLVKDDGFKEGVTAAFPNAEELDAQQHKDAMRGKESE